MLLGTHGAVTALGSRVPFPREAPGARSLSGWLGRELPWGTGLRRLRCEELLWSGTRRHGQELHVDGK